MFNHDRGHSLAIVVIIVTMMNSSGHRLSGRGEKNKEGTSSESHDAFIVKQL